MTLPSRAPDRGPPWALPHQPPRRPPPLTHPSPSQACSPPRRQVLRSLLLCSVHKAPFARMPFPSLLSQSRASRRGFSRGTLPSRSQPASAPRLRVPPAFLPVTLLCGSLRVCLPDHTGGSGTGLAHGHRRLLMGAFEGGEKAVPGGEHTGQPRPSALQSPAPWRGGGAPSQQAP